MDYRPNLIDRLITHNRIGVYKKAFATTDDAGLVGVYLWNIQVCSTLYAIISLTEVSLRNSIDSALRSALGNFWWKRGVLRYKSYVQGGPEPVVVGKVIENFKSASMSYQRSQKKVRNSTLPHHQIPLDHGGVISRTDFSTWEYILDQEFSGNGLIWPALLHKAFPGDWEGMHGDTRNFLTYTRNLVKLVREFRNRVSHNEAAWKRSNVKNESDAINHLQEKIDRIENLFRLLTPQKTNTCDIDHFFAKARLACSINEIRRYQKLVKPCDIATIDDLYMLVSRGKAEQIIFDAVLAGVTDTAFSLHPLSAVPIR